MKPAVLLAALLIWAAPAPAQRAQPRRPPAAAAPATPSYKDLKYPPLHPIEIPQVDTVTLPNGMRIYLLEDHELPLINGSARVRTGNLFDPPDKIDLATMTGVVIRSGGTAAKTGDQLNEELENIAASVESSIGESAGSVSFSALKENTDEVLGIFHDVLTAPAFRTDKVDLAKAQFRSAISRRNDDAHGILEREFAGIVYGKNTPYGWDDQYATVDNIKRGDLQNFYQRYFFPKNVILAVWGDFDTAQMKAKLTALFSGWNAQQPPVPPFPAVTAKAAPGIYLAVKTSDIGQTFFSMGELGGEYKDKDFPALEIMADILGGGFQSRLFQRVRTRMGDAYDIEADWGANYDHPGLFQISGSTKSVSTVETLQAVRQEVDRIRTTEVTEDELKTAKDTALNSLVFAFDTRAKTLGRLLTYEYYGYPRDFIQQYQKALAAVTRADVLRVAKEHLDPAKFATVAVGNPSQFGQPLDALGGSVRPIDIGIPEPKAEAVHADAGSLEKGKLLLARAQQAVGGADKLAAVKDYAQVSDIQLEAAAGGVKSHKTDRWLAPNYLRQDSESGRSKIAAFCDGKTGWIAAPQGLMALTGAPLKQVQGDMFRVYYLMLLSDRIPGRTVNAIDENTVEISDGAGQVARMTFDSATGLPQSVTYQATPAAGPPVDIRTSYSDFRDVDGIKTPFKTAIEQGGRKFGDAAVTEYKTNTGLKLEDLQKRP